MSTYSLRLSDAEVARYTAMAEIARRQEGDLWERAGIVAGARIADVGCGPGAVLALLAEIAGPQGHVSGVDGDPEAVAAAQTLAAARGLAATVDVRVGRAEDTGLDPGAYDVVVMRHVLAHNGPTEQAIVDHLASLLRPGGRVYLLDIDGLDVRVEPPVPELDALQERYWELHRRRGNDLRTGPRLVGLVGAAGLDVVEARVLPMAMPIPPGARGPAWAARHALVADGLATGDEVAAWGGLLARVDEAEERPTAFTSLYVAIGRRRNAG